MPAILANTGAVTLAEQIGKILEEDAAFFAGRDNPVYEPSVYRALIERARCGPHRRRSMAPLRVKLRALLDIAEAVDH